DIRVEKIHGTACKHRNPPPRFRHLEQRHTVPKSRGRNIYAHFMQHSEMPESMDRQYFPYALKKFQHFKAGGCPLESKLGGNTKKPSSFAGYPEAVSPLVYGIGNLYPERTKRIACPAKHTAEDSFVKYFRRSKFSLYKFFKQENTPPGTHPLGDILTVCWTQCLTAAAPNTLLQ